MENENVAAQEENKAGAASAMPFFLYCAGPGFENLDASEAQKNRSEHVRAPNEENHSQIEKGDEEDRFGKAAASQNSQNLAACGIYLAFLIFSF